MFNWQFGFLFRCLRNFIKKEKIQVNSFKTFPFMCLIFTNSLFFPFFVNTMGHSGKIIRSQNIHTAILWKFRQGSTSFPIKFGCPDAIKSLLSAELKASVDGRTVEYKHCLFECSLVFGSYFFHTYLILDNLFGFFFSPKFYEVYLREFFMSCGNVN